MADETPINNEKIQEDARAVAKAEVEKLKTELVSNIQGKKSRYSWEEKGKDKPDSYDELFDENDKRYVKKEDVEDRAREAAQGVLAERDKQAEEEATKKIEEDKKKFEETKAEFDKDWYDLINQEKMPKVSEEIQVKIDKNEKLTKEEFETDDGLKARAELANLVRTTGKTAKVAFYEEYKKEPAGAKAPVLGGRPSTPQTQSDELSYEDTVKARKKIFDF